MSNNRILWTATGAPLTSALWSELRRLDCEVMVEESHRAAREKLAELSPRVWVGEVAGEDDAGFQDLSELLSSHPQLSVLLISKTPNVNQAVAAIKMGAADYLPADVSAEHLSAVLEGLLLRQVPLKRPAAADKTPPAEQLIAEDAATRRVVETAKKIAPRRTTILIQGESGTGKEVLARFIHRSGDRRDAPFVAVNCAALPENLLESELFGHEKGAFTGAASRKKGKFELADGGTLLLDEISEMPLSLQAKLLRVLQEREIDRVGGQFAVPVDVRVIATTNRELEEETKRGNFRLDLYYRLNVVPLALPPLRERREDILPLASHFLEKHGRANGERPKRLSKEAGELLKGGDWTGNVRELENLMERASLLVESDSIHSEDLLDVGFQGGARRDSGEDSPDLSLKEMEKKMIIRALQDQDGNRTHAAKVLGISVRTLRNKLHEYRKELETEGL